MNIDSKLNSILSILKALEEYFPYFDIIKNNFSNTLLQSNECFNSNESIFKFINIFKKITKNSMKILIMTHKQKFASIAILL